MSIPRMVKWLKVKKYEELTGDSASAVKQRRYKGIWCDGCESKLKNGSIWINLYAIDKWLNLDSPPLMRDTIWVKAVRYQELTGDTIGAVKQRRYKGIWLDGRESKLIRGRLWVNLEAVEQWIEANHRYQPVLRSGRASLAIKSELFSNTKEHVAVKH